MGLLDRDYMHSPPPPPTWTAVEAAPAPQQRPKARKGFDWRYYALTVFLGVLLTVALAGVTRTTPTGLEMAGMTAISVVISLVITRGR